MVVVVAAARIGFAQDAQRFFRRHPGGTFQYHEAKVHSGEGLFPAHLESQRAGAIQRRFRRRQTENLMANHRFAVRIFVHQPWIVANQATDLQMTQIAQSIEGLGLHLIKRLRHGLKGQGGQWNRRQAHLCRRGRGQHRQSRERVR
jgi:hypothetical protein